MARRPHRPADPDRVGAHLATVLLPPARADAAGMNDLPDPLEDLDAALRALRDLDR